MPVLVQPGLRIEVLPREAQVDGAQLQAGSSIAEGRALPPPYRDAGRIGTQPRGGQVIGVQVGRSLAAERIEGLGLAAGEAAVGIPGQGLDAVALGVVYRSTPFTCAKRVWRMPLFFRQTRQHRVR